MHTMFLLPALGLVALVLYKLLATIHRKRQDALFARNHNCQPVPEMLNGGFLGLGNIREMNAADESKTFPDLMLRRQQCMDEAMGRPCSTYVFTVLGTATFNTTDPKNIQALLATQFDDFELGKLRREIMGPTFGNGIFVVDGKKWEHSRAMLRPNFVRDQVSDLEMEERHVQALFSVMPVHADGWTDFTDIQELFFRLTVDSATEFLFGESTHTQVKVAGTGATEEAPRNERVFAHHFDAAQMQMARKFRYADFHWLHNPQELKDSGKIINDFVSYYVDLALSKSRQKGALPANEEKSAGRTKYVFLENLAEQTQDPEEIRAQLLNTLLAGRDTTASLLSWTMHELLRHPAVFAKLRAVVVATFGPCDPADEARITFAALKGCAYLQHVVAESLRLWPVVPGNSRRSIKRTTLPRGGGPDGTAPVFIPADTQVEYSVHVMMRRKDLWGQDANSFRPERFEGRKSGWEYLPFNGGPRICIGQQFALAEASYVLVRLLQKFDQIEARSEDLAAEVLSNLTLINCPGRPVVLRLHEAKA